MTTCDIKQYNSKTRFFLTDVLFTPARMWKRSGEFYLEAGFRYVQYSVSYNWTEPFLGNHYHSSATVEGLMPLASGGLRFHLSRGYLAFDGRIFAGWGPDSYTAGVSANLVLWPGRVFHCSLGGRLEKLDFCDGGFSSPSRKVTLVMSGPTFELGFRF